MLHVSKKGQVPVSLESTGQIWYTHFSNSTVGFGLLWSSFQQWFNIIRCFLISESWTHFMGFHAFTGLELMDLLLFWLFFILTFFLSFRSIYDDQPNAHKRFMEKLDARIRNHDREIEKMCNFHHQGFVDAITELLKVRTDAEKLMVKTFKLTSHWLFLPFCSGSDFISDDTVFINS